MLQLDRLVLELQLSPVEAFYHLRRVLESANALAASLVASELLILREANNIQNVTESFNNSSGDINGTQSPQQSEEDSLTSAWTFAPENGNVIFASALDCWGFGTGRFATIWAKKLSVNRAVLLKYMFEDYAFHPKTKKLIKCDSSSAGGNQEILQPLFASLVLDPLWQLYKTCITLNDPTKAANMAKRGVRFYFNIEV